MCNYTPNTDMFACRVDCATVQPGLQVCQESCVPVSPAMYDPWYARQFCHDPWAVSRPCCDYRPLRYGCGGCGGSCNSCSSSSSDCCLLPKVRCGSATGPLRTVVYTDADGCRRHVQSRETATSNDAVSKYSPAYIARSMKHNRLAAERAAKKAKLANVNSKKASKNEQKKDGKKDGKKDVKKPGKKDAISEPRHLRVRLRNMRV